MPFLPLLLGLAPTVASWIMGDKTGAAITKVTGIAREILGTDDANGIERALAADPAKALEFKMALLQAEASERAHVEEMRRQDLDTLKTQLADVASARAQTVELAKTGSPIAYGAVVVSVLSIALAGAVAYMLLFGGDIAAKWVETIATMLAGAAIGWVNVVQNYWLGSSSGSAAKNDMLTKALTTK